MHRTVVVLALLARACGARGESPDGFGSKPHLVVLLADNVGWANVGFHMPPHADPDVAADGPEGVVLRVSDDGGAVATYRFWRPFLATAEEILVLIDGSDVDLADTAVIVELTRASSKQGRRLGVPRY